MWKLKSGKTDNIVNTVTNDIYKWTICSDQCWIETIQDHKSFFAVFEHRCILCWVCKSRSAGNYVQSDLDVHCEKYEICVKPLPHMLILDSSNSAANKNMMS